MSWPKVAAGKMPPKKILPIGTLPSIFRANLDLLIACLILTWRT
jgi:hypothetical protein